MKTSAQRWVVVLRQHQRLSTATGVIAGFVGAVSVLFSGLALRFAPHGWHRAAVALHIERQPLIMKLVPLIGGIALALAILAALLRFVSWCLEGDPEADRLPGNGATHE